MKYHDAVSTSYPSPKLLYNPTCSIIVFCKVVVNVVFKFCIISDNIAVDGMRSFNMIGPVPFAKLPSPLLLPSPVTETILAHAMSDDPVWPPVPVISDVS